MPKPLHLTRQILARLLNEANVYSYDGLDAKDFRATEHLGLTSDLANEPGDTLALELYGDLLEGTGDSQEPDYRFTIDELLAGNISRNGHVLTVNSEGRSVDLCFGYRPAADIINLHTEAREQIPTREPADS